MEVVADVGPRTTLEVGTSVVAKVDNGWYAGTVVKGDPPYHVVFEDGTTEDVDTVRVWARPTELPWHKRRKRTDKHGHSSMRAVEQLDATTLEPMARFPTARRACEQLPWVPGPEDVVNCCRGFQPQAGGFKWRFAEPRGKLDGNDVNELLAGGAIIAFQQTNPKKAGTKSADLYDKYKSATTFREMLNLGGRRADISYDLTHGWIAFEDPEMARRFGCAVADS